MTLGFNHNIRTVDGGGDDGDDVAVVDILQNNHLHYG